MNVETINAIAGLWKLAFVVTVLIFGLVFRKPLISLVARLTKFQLKRGATELATELLAVKSERSDDGKSAVALELKTESKIIPAVVPVPSNSEEEDLGHKEPEGPLNAMLDAAFSKSLTKTEEAYNKLQQATDDDEKKLSNEAIYNFLRYRLGDASSMGKLMEMTNNEKAKAFAHQALGFCYHEGGDFEKAAHFFELASRGFEEKGPREEDRRISSFIRATECLAKIGRSGEAKSNVMREIAKTDEHPSLGTLYEALATLYEQNEEFDLQALALEKALEQKPNDTGLRFSAGFSYGKQDSTNGLAFLHYRTLLQFDNKHATAQNNLGVQYERLQMPIRSNRYYQKSADLNQTLASANLASGYISAGFADEARKVLDAARQQSYVDPKVGEQIARLSKTEEEESKIEERELKAAREQQRFLLSFAEAYFVHREADTQFEGIWMWPDGNTLNISVTGNTIQADWKESTLEERFVGTLSNRAAKIKYQHVWTTEWKDEKFGYAYLLADGSELHVMTFNSDRSERYLIQVLRKGSNESGSLSTI